MHFIGVFNTGGGTFRTMDMAAFSASAVKVFEAHGHTLDCRAVAGDDLLSELTKAARDPGSDVLLAGGGDGTISAAAGICFAEKMPLAVLPAGTMNLFARSLGIPLELGAALEAIAGGELTAVDIATANGRPFVHQYSVGMHTRLVRIRNGLTYSSRWGKMLASVRAVTEALKRPLRFDVEILTRKGSERRRATAIAVSNNLLSEGHVPYAEILDRGVLGVYVVKPMPALELAKLSFSLIFGSWKAHPLVSEREVQQLSLRFPRRSATAQAVIDGELEPLPPRVDLKIHAKGLQVIVPRPATAVADADETAAVA